MHPAILRKNLTIYKDGKERKTFMTWMSSQIKLTLKLTDTFLDSPITEAIIETSLRFLFLGVRHLGI